MQVSIQVSEENNAADRQAISQALLEFNLSRAPEPDFRPLNLLLKDATGHIVGGLSGASRYRWLFVELLFVPEALRGYGLGIRLLRQAEDIARKRGCIGVWLDTFDFQALGFYQKLGYTKFGELRDHPPGISQHWLQKRLDA